MECLLKRDASPRVLQADVQVNQCAVIGTSDPGKPRPDRGRVLTRSILSAAGDPEPKYTLSDIAHVISGEAIGEDLLKDVLSILPALIPSDCDGVDEILKLVGRCCNGKELIIGVQECAERLARDDDETKEGSTAASALQMVRMMPMPRVKTRKRASQTIQTAVDAMVSALPVASSSASLSEGRALARTAAELLDVFQAWVSVTSHSEPSETSRCTDILCSFLASVLECSANRLGTSLSQRLFEGEFSKLVVESAVRPDWLEGEEAVGTLVYWQRAAAVLGRPPETISSRPSVAPLLLIAHGPLRENLSLSSFTAIFPAILTALQTNVALDEALAVLFTVLFPKSPLSDRDLPPDLIIPLCTVLPSLCSVHPDAPTRHLSFRLLGRLLQLSPSALRLQVLKELLAPSEDAFPQMRVSAIGLAKEFIVDSLGRHSKDRKNCPCIFATPIVLQAIGPFVFRPDPPDLLSPVPCLNEFVELPESKRLVECLGLYYVLLLRDVDNKTGIRDPSTVRSIESSLLHPLRNAMQRWSDMGQKMNTDDRHAVLSLAPLEIGLSRVEEALKIVRVAA
ncbi:hypothetical protein K488DRAFT_75526 [Vararia minispora EC-137]|uniref:Uncharacterized protein n=1 Tax=Vararia minispora EC-137 TaxID=1314806 RepID=A0ACB8R0R9_9AGAM|nr:hypothetical protein K488DRAFT_75526 [Vararia minispora EC-137]